VGPLFLLDLLLVNFIVTQFAAIALAVGKLGIDLQWGVPLAYRFRQSRYARSEVI
jgi:hypothetical protein